MRCADLAPWLVAGLAVATPARAQPRLDAAERALEEAQFERASELLIEAEGADAELDRDDVARLLTLRAVAAQALGREAELERALGQLAATLDGREARGLPSNLRDGLDAARAAVPGAPAVELAIEPAGEQLSVSVGVRDDPTELVRATELVCTADGVEVLRTERRRASVAARGEVRCEATARGPGGWRLGTASGARRTEQLGGEPAWPWIVGGVGAGVVLTAILIGIGVALSSSRSVGGPEWVTP